MCGIVAVSGSSDHALLDSMLTRIEHRGPDGSGVLRWENGGLGHRRLAIIDVKGGAQPLATENREQVIIFNGEIYNFNSLRQELEAAYAFKTRSDTEVLLRLYQLKGESCVEDLQGMFAFIVLDQGKLFATRDPLGVKPLYYAFDSNGERQLFSSEIKAFPPGVMIREFPPGVTYTPESGFKRYYSVPSPKAELQVTEDRAVRELTSELRQSVRRRLVSDVPVGVLLSGGLDSSLIAAMMSAELDELHSFTVGVEGSADLEAARTVAGHLGTKHHERIFTVKDMIAALPEVIYFLESFDAPLVRSAIPNYFLAKLASQHVKVALGGEGADEIFGGYEYFRNFWSHEEFDAERKRITSQLHSLNLQRTDRMSMACGLEVRVPFLDPKLVRYAFGLPTDLLVPRPNYLTKALLRKVAAAYLPANIVDRKKEKFAAGAGSSTCLESFASKTISCAEFEAERDQGSITLRSKEELLYYRHYRNSFGALNLSALHAAGARSPLNSAKGN